MARTMVEDVHGVKPLPFAAAPRSRQNACPFNGIQPHGFAPPYLAPRIECVATVKFLIRLWELTQP